MACQVFGAPVNPFAEVEEHLSMRRTRLQRALRFSPQKARLTCTQLAGACVADERIVMMNPAVAHFFYHV
jgi:ribosomal protein L22